MNFHVNIFLGCILFDCNVNNESEALDKRVGYSELRV